MYGTIGRLRIKAGMEGQFRQLIEGQAPAFEAGQVPGFEVSYVYRMDADARTVPHLVGGLSASFLLKERSLP